jgi:hypothetical protein
VSTHYLHAQKAHREGIIQNRNIKKIVKDGIFQVCTITKGHLNSLTNIEEPLHLVSSEST